MASNEIQILEERIRHLEQQLKLQQVQFGKLAQSVFDNSELRNLKDMNALKKAVTEIDHGSLLGLNDDDHSQYLNTTRHDTTDRHTLGTVVPHDSHGSLSGLNSDDHSQYLNTTRHDTTDRHTLGTVVPHDSHGSLSGLNSDDHSQYLNTTRHDTTDRHTLGTVVPHDDHGSLSGLNDDDHSKYTLAIASSVDNEVPRFDGTDGRKFQSSGMNIDDSGNVSTAAGNQPACPTTTTDTGIIVADGTDGKKIKSTPAKVDASGNMELPSAASLKLKSYNLGEWAGYTVNWTAATTNPSIGNGTIAGRYTIIGKLCACSIRVVMGSTTTYGSGNWAFSIPVNAANNNGLTFLGFAHLRDTGAANYDRFAQIVPVIDAGKIIYFNDPTQGTNNFSISSTVPFTWGNGDAIDIFIFYEIA